MILCERLNMKLLKIMCLCSKVSCKIDVNAKLNNFQWYNIIHLFHWKKLKAFLVVQLNMHLIFLWCTIWFSWIQAVHFRCSWWILDFNLVMIKTFTSISSLSSPSSLSWLLFTKKLCAQLNCLHYQVLFTDKPG